MKNVVKGGIYLIISKAVFKFKGIAHPKVKMISFSQPHAIHDVFDFLSLDNHRLRGNNTLTLGNPHTAIVTVIHTTPVGESMSSLKGNDRCVEDKSFKL